MTAPTILDRRAAAQAAIATLEREQGAAALDGKRFDPTPLNLARLELDALDAAEAEAVRRARATEVAERAQESTEARKRLAGLLDRYVEAVGDAEASAKALADNLKEVEALAGQMRGEVRQLRHVIPISLDANEGRNKLSAMLATVLRAVSGGSRFGGIKWNSMIPITDWKAHARKYVAEALQPIIKGG